MKEIKFKGKRFLFEERDKTFNFGGTVGDLHESEFMVANDYRCYAILKEDGKIMRLHQQIGIKSDIEFGREISAEEMGKYKIKTKDVNFEVLEGQKIILFKEDDATNAFWGDSVDRFIIKTNNGKVYVMETGGGGNTMGFPGSQCHGVWLQEILNPEILEKK